MCPGLQNCLPGFNKEGKTICTLFVTGLMVRKSYMPLSGKCLMRATISAVLLTGQGVWGYFVQCQEMTSVTDFLTLPLYIYIAIHWPEFLPL